MGPQLCGVRLARGCERSQLLQQRRGYIIVAIATRHALAWQTLHGPGQQGVVEQAAALLERAGQWSMTNFTTTNVW